MAPRFADRARSALRHLVRPSWTAVLGLALLAAIMAVGSAFELTWWVRFLGDNHPSTITVTERSRRDSPWNPGWVKGRLPDGREVEVTGWGSWSGPARGETIPVRVHWSDPPDVRHDGREPFMAWVTMAATPLVALAAVDTARHTVDARRHAERTATEKHEREIARIQQRRDRLDRRRARRGDPPRDWPPL